MKNEILYPVIAKEYDDDGHYYVVTSPNVQGMVVEGDTLDEAIGEASYDIADWFEVKGKVEKVVRKNISILEYLANWAKENKINVSRVASDALRALQEQQA